VDSAAGAEPDAGEEEEAAAEVPEADGTIAPGFFALLCSA
jgi:hypothetical protein